MNHPQSVGDMLDEMDGKKRDPDPTLPARFEPARLDGCPSLPEPGIYFGMSDEEYHALPALSNHGIKYLAASPMLFWSRTAWLCEKKRQAELEKLADEKSHNIVGKAYHCRIMEGREAFEQRFVAELDPADYPDALVHTDQIKAAIMRHKERVPVKPCSARRSDLQEQLRVLLLGTGSAIPQAELDMLCDSKVDDLKRRIGEFVTDQPVKPWAKVTDTMPDTGEEYQRAAVKADWIRQLRELDPEAVIFDCIQSDFLKEHEGKGVVTLEQRQQLEIAAAMVERDPEVRHAFKGGYAEVVFIWYCPTTGVPMKARVDYLKIKAMVDLKTVANQRERSIENAIRFEIASYNYNIQPRVYTDGALIVRQLVREQGANAVHVAEDYPYPADEVVTWALKWASHQGDDEWLWVFQQKGDAPITRGVFYPLAGLTNLVTLDIVDTAKRRFREFSETFGTDPWLDVKPIYLINDEDIPRSSTEI